MSYEVNLTVPYNALHYFSSKTSRSPGFHLILFQMAVTIFRFRFIYIIYIFRTSKPS